jgi:hypothetical protein
MQFDLSSFESEEDVVPLRLLSVHPGEPFIALQIARGESTAAEDLFLERMRVAIWNRETHELLTMSKDVLTLAWNADGSEMGLIRRYINVAKSVEEESGEIFHYAWERLSWPEQAVIGSCELYFSMNCWPEVIVFSPQGDLALIQWFEEEKSGLEFVDLTKYGDVQLENPGLPPIEHEFDDPEDGRFYVEANLATAPVFSPDGRFIVFGWQRRQRWWTDVPDDVYVEGELSARTGECLAGHLQLIDGEKLTNHAFSIFVTLPPGWQPSYDGDRSNELLPDPVFVDNEHFSLLLPTGETRIYSALI